MRILLFLACPVFPIVLSAQEVNLSKPFHGRILHAGTQEPIAYVNIFNKTQGKGTISNAEGYFQIPVTDSHDSIFVSFIGFQAQVFFPRDQEDLQAVIYLEESSQLLPEVMIVAPDDGYLYELLSRCRESQHSRDQSAKAYYELKSYAQGKQIELVEAFYHADTRAYDLSDLKMKAGRFALRNYGNRLFTTLESSSAITKLKLFDDNQHFPKSPLGFPKSQIRKHFYLELDKKYVDDNLDSIYVIHYMPKDSSGSSFEGNLWIDPVQKQVIKLTLNCHGCSNHPFLPLFPTDSLVDVDMRITKTFKEIEGDMYFHHIDFTYEVDYQSRVARENELFYTIASNAILHLYDYDDVFILPRFRFAHDQIRDYYRINAMPYNTFFWENNDEFRLNDQQQQNQRFFSQNAVMSNKTLFEKNAFTKVPLFEFPFIQWSPQRILISNSVADTLNPRPVNAAFKSEQYRLSAKFYMDINTYADSTHVITAAIFDPYESFYYLPITNTTHCFLNMLFDLYEVERRSLEKDIASSDRNVDTILQLFEESNARMDKIKDHYIKEVVRGSNKMKMIEWNQYIRDQLGIDNVAFFNPFDDSR